MDASGKDKLTKRNAHRDIRAVPWFTACLVKNEGLARRRCSSREEDSAAIARRLRRITGSLKTAQTQSKRKTSFDTKEPISQFQAPCKKLIRAVFWLSQFAVKLPTLGDLFSRQR
jgi:hypothetical protein